MSEFSVALTENMLAEVQAAVDAGKYGSVSEVVRDALRDWRLRRRAEVFETYDLRRLVREGMDSGPGIDADHVFARSRSRMALQMGAARDSANAARALAG